jgi:hypothetical protein
MRFRALTAAAALFVAGAATAADDTAVDASSVEVLRAAFGLFSPAGSSQPPFVATNRVPLVVDQAYGWVIVIKTSAKTVRWREEFTLPAAPATWGGPDPSATRSMSDDARTTITEREVSAQDGVILHAWSVAAGDPAGTYRMRVSIDGRLVRTFEFQVR